MANYILCYHTGSGVIQRVVNADVVNFEKCGLSDKETKIQISDSSENGNPSSCLDLLVRYDTW